MFQNIGGHLGRIEPLAKSLGGPQELGYVLASAGVAGLVFIRASQSKTLLYKLAVWLDDIAHGGGKTKIAVEDAVIKSANSVLDLMKYLPGGSVHVDLPTHEAIVKRVQEIHASQVREHDEWLKWKAEHDAALKLGGGKPLDYEAWIVARGFHHPEPGPRAAEIEAHLRERYQQYQVWISTEKPEPFVDDLPSSAKPMTADEAALFALATFLILQHPEIIPMCISAVGDILNGIGQITIGVGEAIPF